MSGKGETTNIDTPQLGQSVFCIPGLGRLDVCAALIVADVLKRQGIVARTTDATAAIEADDAETICVCFLEDVTEARTDFTQRKLSRQAPSAKVVICRLGQTNKIRENIEPTNDNSLRSLKGVLSTIKSNPPSSAFEPNASRNNSTAI